MVGAVPIAFVLRRAATALLTLLLASVMVFGALLVVPGDPVQLILGFQTDPELYAATERRLGLDRPPLERYAAWVAGLARGDMGTSVRYSEPVSALIISRLPVTLPLVIASTALALLVSLPLGVLAAARRGTLADAAVVAASQAGLAIPSFWLGLLLILLFAVALGWLPSGGFPVAWSQDPVAAARPLVLPVLTLALGQTAGLVRMVRSGVLDVLGQDYVRTARSKGLSEARVVRRHVLRNALVGILTLAGLQFTQLLAGAIVVESVFNLPALGTLALEAVNGKDFPLVQGVVMVLAAAIVTVNLLVDLLYGALDPRIRFD